MTEARTPDARVRETAREVAVEVCWEQWRALGFLAGDAPRPLAETFIDPEALLVVTLDAVRAEPRLDAALGWWASVGASLLSLPRLDTALGLAPEGVEADMARFAARVVATGSASASWKRRASGAEATPPDRIKGLAAPRLTAPPAVMLQLRAAFGVGAKADVITFLLAQRGRAVPVREMEAALGYSALTLQRAAQDLAAAGLATDESALTPEPGPDPSRYALRPDGWHAVLGFEGTVPPWRSWLPITAFLLHAARWGRDLLLDDPDREYLLASSARRLYDLAQPFRREHGLDLPDPARHPASAYLPLFVETVERLAAWLRNGLPEASVHTLHPAPMYSTTSVGSAYLIPTDMTRAYLQQIEATLATGDATEHSHRPALQTLLEAAGETALGRRPAVVNEPRRTRVGAPDFVVQLGGVPLGYAEAKDVGVALDADAEQLTRYRAGLRNLLFTDYLTFRWFADGTERDAVTLADRRDGRIVPRDGAADALADLLGAFFRFEAPTITTARELATRMAASARLIRFAIERAFETEPGGGSLHQQFEAFREVLLHDLSPERFADMYAQTLAYGLFAARAAAPEATDFSRLAAAAHLPRTNPFLRKLFYYIAGPDLDDRIAWLVDDLAALLARADLARILTDFGRRTRQEDAVVHFYETFLAAYNPTLRELRGVYYPPEPVVAYLVRSVDRLLARDFELADGLADTKQIEVEVPDPDDPGVSRTEAFHRVQVLDPAAGTGTFLHHAIRTIRERFEGNEGLWDGYVADHLLPRLHGFELLMAPYTVAHMKLGLLLAQTGYRFDRDERLGLYLTNALDDAGPAGQLPFAQWLAEEANAASRVKHEVPVMVVLGNPPYSGHSANPSEQTIPKVDKGETYIVGWKARSGGGAEPVTRRASRRLEDVAQPTPIGQLIRDYFFVDGKPLGERNPKWLNDDYVKFIRMAQEQIVQTGQGVLAFVTNHGFLDNPTFRGMRQSLMTAFDRLYVLDLHGNAKKKETAPGGGRDENVFDIMQGVAISLFVRLPEHDDADAEVYHADLWGLRADKYAALDTADVTSTEWERIDPRAPFYLFRPVDREFRDEYDEGWKVTDIFPVSNTGMVTARDKFVLGFDRDEVLERVRDFARLPLEEARTTYKLRDTRERTLEESQKLVRAMDDPAEHMQTVLYRPFDERSIFYHQALVRWPVYGLMHHMLDDENVALAIGRAGGATSQDEWNIIFASIQPTDFNLFRRGGNVLFPLWLYPEPDGGLFDAADGERTANLAPAFVAALEAATGLAYAAEARNDRRDMARHVPTPADEPASDTAFAPEDAFRYVYGVLHAPAYRARYADFLRTDYPRVPLPPSADAFHTFADLGRRLVALHLLRDVPDTSVHYPVKGSNTVEKGYPKYAAPGEAGLDGETAETGRVYINDAQHFDGVEPEVWTHEVGGYQVLDKWLKDRRGRTLTYDDLRRYPRIVAALRETQRLMAEAEEIAEEAFGW